MRKSWDHYFMDMAKVAATRATCDRKHVGAVIVRNRTVLSTGYNGSIRGAPHCDEVGHEMENDHCVRTVHAEANAIVQAAKNGVNIDGSSIYTTASPCFNCFKLIVNCGITRIIFGEMYRDERITKFAADANISLVDLSQVDYRCGECIACTIEKLGCACDGSMDQGCFLCTPDLHERPPCPARKVP